MLAEHDDPHGGMILAEAAGDVDALGGVGRRHPDVDDGDVGRFLGHHGEQFVAIGRGAEDLDVVDGSEGRAGAFPDEIVVVTDVDGDGHRRGVPGIGGRGAHTNTDTAARSADRAPVASGHCRNAQPAPPGPRWPRREVRWRALRCDDSTPSWGTAACPC